MARFKKHEEAGVAFEYYIKEEELSYKMNCLRCEVEDETIYEAFGYIFKKEEIEAQDNTGPVVDTPDLDGWYRFPINSLKKTHRCVAIDSSGSERVMYLSCKDEKEARRIARTVFKNIKSKKTYDSDETPDLMIARYESSFGEKTYLYRLKA